MSQSVTFTGPGNVVSDVSSSTPLPITGTVAIGGGGATLTPSSGQTNVAAGPVATPLAGVATQVDELIVVAKITNLGNIFLGSAAVTTLNGLIMEPGRGVAVTSADLNTIYINGTAGEGVSWFALT